MEPLARAGSVLKDSSVILGTPERPSAPRERQRSSVLQSLLGVVSSLCNGAGRPLCLLGN